MIGRYLDEWRQRLLARRAAAWVVALDEDQQRHAPGLRRWVGQSDERAALYNRAYRAYHGAAAPARRIYGSEHERTRQSNGGAWAGSGRHFVAVACALIVTVIACRVLLLELNSIAGGQQERPFASQAYATRVGEIRTIRLPDGSLLTLDTGTRLRVAFSQDRRNILLVQGRARFEVAHNAAWPFVVTAGGGTVTAKGTVFDVEAGRMIEVRLITGAVAVAYPRGLVTPSRPIQQLSAGQELRFDPAMRARPTAPVRASTADARWTQPLRTFDDVPVGDVVAEVNRYSNRQIRLDGADLDSRRVFLDVDVRDSEDVARAIAAYLNLDVDQTADGDFTLRAKTGLS